MRYQARWSNGLWKIFDRVKFADVATRATLRDAEEGALEFNASEFKSRQFTGRRR